MTCEGGGLTAQGRSRREQVRLRAAEMFEHDTDARQIAGSLRVSTKSVYQWRRAWREGGEAALASKGAGGNPCKLDEALVMRLFGVSYTLRGISFLLHRLGFSPQAPAHRAYEQSEDAVAAWRTATWAKVRG